MNVLVRMRYSQALRLVPCLNCRNAAIGLDEGLLHEIRGVRRVPRHPHRRRVQLVHVRQRLLLEQRVQIIRLDLDRRLGVGAIDARQDGCSHSRLRRIGSLAT